MGYSKNTKARKGKLREGISGCAARVEEKKRGKVWG